MKFNYIISNALINYKNKYKTSIFGYLWILINPIVLLLIYAFVFTTVMSSKIQGIDNEYSYMLYLSIGIMPWGIFASMLLDATSSIQKNANYIKKINMPIWTYVSISVVENLFNLIVIFLLLIVFLGVVGITPSLKFLLLIIPIGLLALFTYGMALFLSSISIFVKDIEQIIGVLIQLLMWSLPIIYPLTIIPESYHWIIYYNPLYYFFDSFRLILLYNEFLPMHYYLIMMMSSFVALLFGIGVLKALDSDIRDNL